MSTNAKPAREHGRSAIIARLIQQADAEQQQRLVTEGDRLPVSIRLATSVRGALTRLEAREGLSATDVIARLLTRSAAERNQSCADEDLDEDEGES